MKNKFLGFILGLLIVACSVSLVGCLGTGDSSTPDYNEKVVEVNVEDITNDYFIPNQDTTYYTSDELWLMAEVNGAFFEMEYFYIDGDMRVYDNLYLYKQDYFFMITGDYKYIYASLNHPFSTEYFEEEKEQGEDIQINVKKSGIYKLTFDVKTLKFDMEYKSEIETPLYYTMKNCSVYTEATSWREMSVNPANKDEFVIDNFSVTADETISFFNIVHTSNYKVTLDEKVNDKLASANKKNLTINVGGTYRIYVNSKTYVVNLELLNPDTATYNCVCYDGLNYNVLTPNDEQLPHVFSMRLVTTENSTGLPYFLSKAYKKYDLTVIASTDVVSKVGKSCYLRKAGTYDLTINLRTFEITIEKLPE